MTKFPLDLLFDIFCCLPGESLLRFRALSKPFCELIDSPDFVKSQLNQSLTSNANSRYIVESVTPFGSIYGLNLDSDEVDFVELKRPFDPFVTGFQGDGIPIKSFGDIFGSFNGLLALYNPVSSMTVWNPSTHEHQTLPNFWGGPRYSDDCFLDGFGYDPKSDDYKVIRIIQIPLAAIDFNRNNSSRVMIYSLKTNKGRRIEDFHYFTDQPRQAGVLFGPSLHWVVLPRREGSESNLIIAFDLRDEKFHTVPMPDLQGMVDINLSVLDGCLSVCTFTSDHIRIWKMEDYGVKESWTELWLDFLFDGRQTRPSNELIAGYEDIPGFRRNHLFWYDREKRQVKPFLIGGSHDHKMNICIRSLVPVNGWQSTHCDSLDDHRRNYQIPKIGGSQGLCWGVKE